MKYQIIKQYKYRLAEKISYDLGFNTNMDHICRWFRLSDDKLTVYKGYCWNGSNVVQDTKMSLEASLVHDVLCQLIAQRLLPERFLPKANKLYRDMCIRGGMSKIRANMRYLGLKIGSRKAVLSGDGVNPVIEI